MKVLLDTNIVIAVEDIAAEAVHLNADSATALLQIVTKHDHELWISRAAADDLGRAKTDELRAARSLQLRKYRTLERIVPTAELRARAGYQSGPLSPNDTADLEVLAALDRGAVDLLVTEDGALRAHAESAGLGSSALSISDATEYLASLHVATYRQRPTVVETKAYAVDSSDAIFESLRTDYADHDPPFDAWWAKCQNEHRRCLVLATTSDVLDGLCVLKDEHDETWGLPEPVLKICLFKVADHAIGAKRGELLLDSVLQSAVSAHASAFVEVFPHHADTVALFEAFGFECEGRTNEGELLLTKRLQGDDADRDMLDPWSFHHRFGPPAIKVERAFVVPVLPEWHDVLFPELAIALDLFGPRPPGNAITKAYVCHSSTKQLQRGDTLLFYRSKERQGVTVAGVVERVVRTGDLERVLGVTGSRTVYTHSDLDTMLLSGDLLVILFRRDRVIDPYWSRATLEENNVLNGAPQSVTQVHSEQGLAWLRTQLHAVH